MCGVAGIYMYGDASAPVDRLALAGMLQAIRHRGPDDEGIFVQPGIGLGHRRLSIVDPSPTGRQPMLTDDGCCLSYNGEFYNHADFRPRLAAKGCIFRGPSDTETLLHLLHREGSHALADVAGIFTFAFWDARHRKLTLGRDPLGVKQLYFHDDGQRIVFASEIKALIFGANLPAELEAEAVNQYLHFHSPLFERTFFRGIEQLLPGESLEISPRTRRRRQTWQVAGFSTASASPAALGDELKQTLRSVVSQQLMSDVPIGAFFSGGIDSTAIAAFAQDAGQQLPCFGVHFDSPGVIDERPFQESAAKALGLQLHLTTVSGDDFADDLLKLMYFQDQPVVGSALIPMHYVSRLAAGSVKACLGGQGADEVFGGYARYALCAPQQALRSEWSARTAAWRRRRTRPSPDEATQQDETRLGGNLRKQLGDARNVRRLLHNVPAAWDWRRRYFEHFSRISARRWQTLLAPELVSRRRAFELFAAYTSASVARKPADRIFDWELRTYLPALFQQDDRMSMANSLESRVPFADPRLVRFGLQLPIELKLRDGATKWLLRRAVADRLPETVLNRRKVGFDNPAESWLRQRRQGFVRDLLLSPRARQRGWYHPAAVEKLLAEDRQADWFPLVWKLVCLEAWAKIFVDRERPVS